ncbi:MAG: YjbQ family protein [Victivallales bacterium]|nr:YjbQ family protein [Victivallales bacterium]
MPFIEINSSQHSEMLDITSKINKLIPADMQEGVCCVFCTHTTAGLTVNENADADVRYDVVHFLDSLVPWDNPSFRHSEGNSAAHIKSSMVGFSQTIPVRGGKLSLGVWQGIYLCEFDGPRVRRLHVTFLRER